MLSRVNPGFLDCVKAVVVSFCLPCLFFLERPTNGVKRVLGAVPSTLFTTFTLQCSDLSSSHSLVVIV